MQETTLTIKGYQDASVPNRFFRQDDHASHLAIVLPGYGYNCDMPLLYFTVSHLLDQGIEVLQVDYTYSRLPEYYPLDAEERQRWLVADVTAACRTALAQREYQRITLIGKSLGTRAMAHLLATEETLQGAKTVWFTPPWHEAPVRASLLAARQPALVVIGTADPHYDHDLAAEIRRTTNGELLVIADTEHGLEVTGDVVRSVQALEQAMRAVQRFIA